MNFSEFQSTIKEIEEKGFPSTEKKLRTFTGRKFTVIARRNGEEKKFVNVGRNSINKMKANLHKEGYHVDIIETDTIANERVSGNIKSRQMEFAQQAFDAANNKWQPEVVKETKKETQATFPWDVVTKGENAWLDNRPIVKVADRNAKNKVARQRAAMFAKINATQEINETMKIYKDGNLVFTSTNEEEIVNYMKENSLSLEDVILYVPNEIYEMLKGWE